MATPAVSLAAALLSFMPFQGIIGTSTFVMAQTNLKGLESNDLQRIGPVGLHLLGGFNHQT
jgi:hypothetical protein